MNVKLVIVPSVPSVPIDNISNNIKTIQVVNNTTIDLPNKIPNEIEVVITSKNIYQVQLPGQNNPIIYK